MMALVVGQLLLVGLSLGRVWERGGEGNGFVRLETGVPSGTPLTIETALDAATRRAQAWAEDAFLFAAGIQVDWPTEPGAAAVSELPGSGWVLFTFGTEKRGEGWKGGGGTLSMLIDRQSGVVIDEREMTWGHAPQRQLDITTYPISSTVSLFAADITIGKTYRNTCPQFRHLSRASFAQRDDGTGAYWLVTYEDSRAAGRPALSIIVDAASGEIMRDDTQSSETAC